MKAVLSNLDFEYSLTGRVAKIPARQRERWSTILRLLPDARDATVAQPGQIYETLFAWGFSPDARNFVSPGQRSRLPSHEAVIVANDKTESHRIENVLGCSLPGSVLVASEDACRQAIQSCRHPWILKHPFGVSGRDRVRGVARHIEDAHMSWARSVFQSGFSLVFEPWLERKYEFSVHYDLSPQGDLACRGACELLTDRSGVFRGHFVDPLLEVGEGVCRMHEAALTGLARQGYHGPVSVDSMAGFLGEQAVLRPITEINARWSFGRLALALRDCVPAGWSYLWWHPSARRFPKEGGESPEIHSKRRDAGLFRLPDFSDRAGRSKTILAAGFETREETFSALGLDPPRLPEQLAKLLR